MTIYLCSYCGKEASEAQRLAGCCGEMHFDEMEVCPACGEGLGEKVTTETDCDFLLCPECGEQWGFK
jgi:hypothetical protein